MTDNKLTIDVNAQTGVWQSDGLPMLYVPRHFFNNLHLNIEQMVGVEVYRQNLFQSGYKSAYFWCAETAKEHALEPMACYRFYLQRLSQRGWGLMAFEEERLSTGYASIKLSHSSFALHKADFNIKDKHNACYMFEGWFAGAADWVSAQLNWQRSFTCAERHCCANDNSRHDCLFVVEEK